MPRISNINLSYNLEQNMLSIRHERVCREDFLRLIGNGYTNLLACLEEAGSLATDIPFVAIENIEPGIFALEIIVPVPRPLVGKDNIRSWTSRPGKVVWCMYQGFHRDMTAVYDELETWITDRRLSRVGPVYEQHYTGLEISAEKRLTKIAIPVA